MKNRIVIIGTHCTGKSTISKKISSILNIPLITECARNYDIPEHPCDKLTEIQRCILNDQLIEEQKNENFISDRSTIDNIAYWIHNSSEYVLNKENKEYIEKAIKNVHTYTSIFLLEPEFPLVDDGFRSLDPIYQQRIDAIIKTILIVYDIQYTKVTGSIDERISKILETIRRDNGR